MNPTVRPRCSCCLMSFDILLTWTGLKTSVSVLLYNTEATFTYFTTGSSTNRSLHCGRVSAGCAVLFEWMVCNSYFAIMHCIHISLFS